MVDLNDPGRDLTRFLLPDVGRLVETGEPQEPYRLLDPAVTGRAGHVVLR
ncbi:hypothetical protein [Streptomyces antarcticus]|nr:MULTISPECIES: hypothetical protein [unclassified Streptomyces]MCY0947198.1 hypothetical protein [Streptomyces sp. H34-AA3]MCZ4087904.1 hypothetical protein [Streptomyces sp. H34-S5]